jgi:hypothetical protein
MNSTRIVSLLTAVTLISVVPFSSGSETADAQTTDSSISTIAPPGGSIGPNTVPTPRSPSANSYLTIDLLPQRGLGWPECTFDLQRYCYEKPTKIDANGVETPIQGVPNSNCHNNDMSSTALCSMDGSDWLEVALNFANGAFTATDTQSIFRWKLRTGKFSPDILMLGDTQKTVVGGNATDGWTLEIWARPALKAYLNGCYSAALCSSTSVATSTSYSISGYSRMLGIREMWPSVESEAVRSALRGTYITTNGMSQSWRFSADTFFVTAVSPHFLPPDSSGKSEITPGYVRVFLPEAYITLDRGYKDLTLVTPDRVKLTVSGENATAKIIKQEGGLLVDTGVEHFSAPNPEMMVLKATDAPLSVSPAVPAETITSSPKPIFLPMFRKGSSKTLKSIAKTKVSQKPKWSASGRCKIKGAKVVASKKSGTCKVTLRVLNSKKKYVVKTTKTFRVN